MIKWSVVYAGVDRRSCVKGCARARPREFEELWLDHRAQALESDRRGSVESRKALEAGDTCQISSYGVDVVEIHREWIIDLLT